ncbi:MAG: DUF2937 family protein [Bacteroidia bacterium]
MFGILFKPIAELTDRVVCVVFAVAATQIPVYINQYLNVLSGAMTEAQRNYDDLEKRAAELKLSVPQFVEHHLSSQDSIFHASGEHFQAMILRLQMYKEAFEKLSNCSAMEKPFIFYQYYDSVLGEAVQFQPGMPLNQEGFMYALVGVVIALMAMMSIRSTFSSKKEIVTEPVKEKTEV